MNVDEERWGDKGGKEKRMRGNEQREARRDDTSEKCRRKVENVFIRQILGHSSHVHRSTFVRFIPRLAATVNKRVRIIIYTEYIDHRWWSPLPSPANCINRIFVSSSPSLSASTEFTFLSRENLVRNLVVKSRSTKIALPSIFSKSIPHRDHALEYSFPSVRDARALLSGSCISSRDFWVKMVIEDDAFIIMRWEIDN